MKIILGLFFSLTILMPFSLLALEKGKWKIEKSDQYCWIGSLAIDSDLSPDKKRGDYYVVVYKNLGNPETIVQVEAGYNYKIYKFRLIKVYIIFTPLKTFRALHGPKKIIK